MTAKVVVSGKRNIKNKTNAKMVFEGLLAGIEGL